MSAQPMPARPEPSPCLAALRGVHRAVAELRRGAPVVLAGAERWLLVAAETASPAGIAEFEALAPAPLLLLEPARAAALLHRPFEPAPQALALSGPTPGLLRALADPTRDMPRPAEPARAVAAPVDAGAALTLAKLARLLPAVVAGRLTAEADTAALLSVGAADILAYPASEAAALTRVAEAPVPLAGARDARLVAFRAPDAGVEHLAIVVGDPASQPAPLVRLHSECFTGDLLGSLRCDCGDQLRGAIARIGAEAHGIVLYLAQEGRGIGLVNKLRAYALQDRGLDTLDANRALGWGADERSFLIAATMLRELGITRLRLLTNNPAKVEALAACGIEVVAREKIVIPANGINDAYLAAKAARFGHLLDP
ncbi:MAG: GTP cyclohydrolase II [Rhodospirillales bacterium]|nr:GTP cyclohydrolase II [Rhodospirillales bacterium]